MCLCKEVVGINTCGKHSCNFSYILVWLDSSCKNHHISLHKDLFIFKQVRSLNHKSSIWLWDYLSNLAFYIIYTVIFNSSSVELIEVFAWSTNVNVENSYICIRVFVTDQHCMFCSVHTADLGTVALPSFIRAAASHTLYKYNVFRSFSIGKSLKMTLCRSCCIHDTLKLKRGDNVLTLAVSVLIIFIQRNHVKTGCNHDCTVFLCNYFILLLIINCTCSTNLGADTAFSGFKLGTMLAVDYRNIWDSLSERNIDSTSVVQTAVKFVWIFLGRTFLRTNATSGTFAHIHASCFLADINGEVTYKAAYLLNLTVCIDVDFLMCCCLYHLRGEDTCRAVQSWEGFVQLGHSSTNTWKLLHNINLITSLCNVKS